MYLKCVQEHKGFLLLVCSLSLGCSASFILTMHHSLGSLLTGMEVPLEIREWKTGGLISGSQWQVGGSTFFKDLVDSGKVDLEKEIHNKCLWFCFSGVLESALNDMRKYWNTHYIRQSCHKTVAGVPDTLYFLPENSGGTDCLILFPQEEIDDVKLECQDAEEENVPQEYFEYLMKTEGIQYPTTYDETLILFSYLTRVADV